MKNLFEQNWFIDLCTFIEVSILVIIKVLCVSCIFIAGALIVLGDKLDDKVVWVCISSGIMVEVILIISKIIPQIISEASNLKNINDEISKLNQEKEKLIKELLEIESKESSKES